MIFFELALYGIRNFTQLTRLAFKPGLNLIQGANGSGKSTICDVLLAVLSPISDRSVQSFRPQKPSDACQAGLIFKTKGERIYRLIRDFAGRKSSLSELDSSNKFHITTQEEEPIAKFLTDEMGGLPLNAFEGLFTMRGSWMPSARAVVETRLDHQASSPVLGSSPALAAETNTMPQDRTQKQKRLKELKAFLAQGDQLAAMEDQLSDLQARSAEAKRRLRMVTEKTAELSRLMQQGTGFESLRDLPEDYHLILETSAQQEHLKNEQLTTIAEDEEFVKQDLAAIPNQPFFLTKFFIAGGVLVLAALILMGALSLGNLFQNLMMVMLLAGAGLMGYAGYLDFGKMNKRKALELKSREAERQRARVEATFKKENAACMDLLKKTGSADVASLKEKIRNYERFAQARRELESQRDQFLGKKTPEELQNDVDTLSRQISDLESKLKSSSTLPSDIYLIQEEVRILEQDLAVSSSADPKPKLDPLPKVAGSDASGRPGFSKEGGDFLSGPLHTGIRTAGVQSLLLDRRSELNAQAARLIEKTGGAPEAVIVVNEQLQPALTTRTKTPVPWEVLSSGQQDICHFMLQLAVAQILSSSHPFPLILDNPLPVLDPPHQQMVLDILREIAQNRQVLLLSSAAYPSRTSDNLIQLK
ncbi:MAG TPA: AAA family ATPase [Nitrospiria bacterium]|nr:AAA family ATPase [Nitrospiria bacterium]